MIHLHQCQILRKKQNRGLLTAALAVLREALRGNIQDMTSDERATAYFMCQRIEGVVLATCKGQHRALAYQPEQVAEFCCSLLDRYEGAAS